MRVEELRIGNCVHFDMNNPREDNEPEQGYVDHIITAKDLNDKETIERLTPIPLTEEWLLKFGFEYNKTLDVFANDTEFIRLKDGIFWFELGSYSVPLKYVHQLQNLYWCLFAEELKLNN